MNIQQIKEKYTCLDYLGDRVVRKTSYGYIARCPWKDDVHPSLTITPNGRGWQDHSTGDHGSIIDLVMRCLNTKDLKRVCREFDKNNFSSFDKTKINGSEEKEFKSFRVVPLQAKGLYAYLHHRGINLSIAKQFLQEAHYSFQKRTDGRYLYALAYQNDRGGYELRGAPYTGNPDGFKGGTSPKGITTHLGIENAPVVVFEGFFDMLSFATLCGGVRHNYVVLNSIVNVPAAIEVLRSMDGKVLLCLDNDKGGDDATQQLADALPCAYDIRSRFAPAKDVNDYLCHINGESGFRPSR